MTSGLRLTDTEDPFESGLLTPPSSQILNFNATITPILARTQSVSPILPTSPSSSPTRPPSSHRRTNPVPKRKRPAILPSCGSSTTYELHVEHTRINARPDIAVTNTDIVTPNPKPRKQHKKQVRSGTVHQEYTPSPTSLLFRNPQKLSTSICTCQSPSKRILSQSPYASNANADYAPSNTCQSRQCLYRTRGRSSTPIPAYEPPSERFTPPREIVVTPTLSRTPKISKSSKRKTISHAKHNTVKKELPEVDLSRAFTPPSPTEDPLLLSGESLANKKSLRSRLTPSFTSSPNSFDVTEAHRSFASRLSGVSNNFDTDELYSNPPAFNLSSMPSSEGWSDSDSACEDFDQTGEYTGKFKLVSIPTKEDPPTSGTRDRMESWGRPVSPFPYGPRLESLLPEAELDDEEEIVGRLATSSSQAALHDLGTSTEREVRVNDELRESNGAEKSSAPRSFGEVFATPRAKESEGGYANRDMGTTESPLFSVVGTNDEFDEDALHTPDDLEDERQVDRELSLELEDTYRLESPKAVASFPIEDTVDSSDDEVPMDSDIIKITSGDPAAAARAAAILRLHDYDCLLASSKPTRRLSAPASNAISKKVRRKTIGDVGIMKRTPSVSQRRTSLQGDNRSLLDFFDAPDEFLCEVENRVNDESFYLNHIPKKALAIFPSPQLARSPHHLATTYEQREWYKADWKCLDNCFKEEQISMGNLLGVGDKTNADEVLAEDVVDRFVSAMGGRKVLLRLGPSFNRNKLLARVATLRKRRRFDSRTPSLPSSSTCQLVPEMDDRKKLQTTAGAETSPMLQHQILFDEAQAIRSTTHETPSVQSQVKGLVFSYLPLLSRVLPPKSSADSQAVRPPLPCPPREVYQTQREPINTPVRSRFARPIHPKELVQLHHAPVPMKRVLSQEKEPTRLVQLKPTAGSTAGETQTSLQSRRSSSGSVKELVRCFEELDDISARTKLIDRQLCKSKPAWKP
ncbi:hypothetical protein BJ138DRAFT_1130682 [Hygrophoropsis aurantiaca]|uniref:Uncharacterized protein n=1 Tax=Hygrophoropsis aurantiaca TaxID=72124 RepID=A0ACB7ZW01_9AGAM|nr:hypothetical protein BJ138DRAFT_1130682 [Hygrophoropsis aurantiaca]